MRALQIMHSWGIGSSSGIQARVPRSESWLVDSCGLRRNRKLVKKGGRHIYMIALLTGLSGSLLRPDLEIYEACRIAHALIGLLLQGEFERVFGRRLLSVRTDWLQSFLQQSCTQIVVLARMHEG